MNDILNYSDWFWEYGWLYKAPVLGGILRLKVNTRTTLQLNSKDFKNYMSYEFVLTRKKQRIVMSCVKFDLSCSEGELIVSSDGHQKR